MSWATRAHIPDAHQISFLFQLLLVVALNGMSMREFLRMTYRRDRLRHRRRASGETCATFVYMLIISSLYKSVVKLVRLDLTSFEARENSSCMFANARWAFRTRESTTMIREAHISFWFLECRASVIIRFLYLPPLQSDFSEKIYKKYIKKKERVHIRII